MQGDLDLTSETQSANPRDTWWLSLPKQVCHLASAALLLFICSCRWPKQMSRVHATGLPSNCVRHVFPPSGPRPFGARFLQSSWVNLSSHGPWTRRISRYQAGGELHFHDDFREYIFWSSPMECLGLSGFRSRGSQAGNPLVHFHRPDPQPSPAMWHGRKWKAVIGQTGELARQEP